LSIERFRALGEKIMKKLITALLLLTVITNSFSAETKLEEVMVGKWKKILTMKRSKEK